MAEEEAVEAYRSSLADLKMNSKPMINVLTMLAEENKQFASQCVEAIEAHVIKAMPSEKLPAMYLIDSIIKNITDSNYLQLFSKNISSTFVTVFEKVDEKTRHALFKLRHTWNDLFPKKVLYALDVGVKAVDPAWPVTAAVPEVAANIHVNPKFLLKQQQENEKLLARRRAEEEETARMEMEERKRLEESELTAKLENEVLLRQQLMAKQQDILRLHQQRLEIELAKARAQLEQQARLLQRDAVKETQSVEVASSNKIAVTKTPGTVAVASKTAAVAPSTRDPRIRPSSNARSSHSSTNLSDHLAVVLPTPSQKPVNEVAAMVQPTSQEQFQMQSKATPGKTGNIFDRLQDLTAKSEEGNIKKGSVVASVATSQPSTSLANEESTRTNQSFAARFSKKQDRKTAQSASPRKETSKVSQISSKVSLQDNKGNKESGTQPSDSRVSRSSYKSGSPRSKSPSSDRGNRDSYGHQRRSNKPVRMRSPSSSDQPPAKFAKRNDQSPRGSNCKSGASARGVRRTSLKEDNFALRGPATSTTSRKRLQDQSSSIQKGDGWKLKGTKDPGHSSSLKKLKIGNDLDVKEANKVSEDFLELFGKEDQDYRCRPALSHPGSVDSSLPPRRDPLLMSPSISSSQSSGWAQFKASRPHEFPFQVTPTQSRRDSLDMDIRSALYVSPGVKQSAFRRAPLLPTPEIDNPSAGNNSKLGGPVTMDILEQQLNELHRLQDMKKHLDEQEKCLFGNALLSQTGLGGVDQQFNELNRLQNLKRDLDEKHEHLKAMVDSGMRISDELTSAFPSFADTLRNSRQPLIRNKHLDVNDESNRSPVYADRNSPRHTERGYHPEDRGGLLGDRPLSLDVRMDHRGDVDAKVLLPTPSCLERDGGMKPPLVSMRPVPSDLGPPKNLGQTCEDDRCYYPDRDSRWSLRVYMQGSRSQNVYNVVIDGRQYEMTFTNRPLKIWLDQKEVIVRLDPETRQLWFDDLSIYCIGEDEKSVLINGVPHTVFVHGPPKKLWIDNQLFDINIDSPPEKINIGGKDHRICIDSLKNRIFVDGFDICPFGTDEPQLVKLAFVMHTIQFHPPCKQILIDGNLCNLDLSGKYPVVILDGKAHGIRFDGEPHRVFIDDKPWMVSVDRSRRCHLDGPTSKPVLLALGGPGHELIIDDQWHEVKFGGLEKYIKVGRKMRKFQLRGNPPEVKILGEMILPVTDNMGSLNRGGPRGPRPPMEADEFHGVRPRQPAFGPQMHNRFGAPDILHRPDSNPDIPSLLDIAVGPKVEQNRSFGQFPGSRPREGYQPVGAFDRHMQGPRPMFQRGGPHGPRPPMEGSMGHGPYDRNMDPRNGGQRFGGPHDGPGMAFPCDPRQGVPPNGDFINSCLPDQTVCLPNVPFTVSGSHQPDIPEQSELRHGLNEDMNASHFVRPFGQFPYGRQKPAVIQPWNPTENVVQQPQEPEQVDVGSLLNRLLAAGLIKNTPENDTSVPMESNDNLQKGTEAGKSSVGEKALEEAKGDAPKEESLEDVPTLTDFNLENLRKRHTGVIQRLYIGVQCPTCGVRFSSNATEKYNEHLDWHFRKNRKEKEEMKVAKFRRWYYDVVDWIKFEEVSSVEERIQSASQPEILELDSVAENVTKNLLSSRASDIITCPIASRNDVEDICETCRESFEQFWDEEQEAWHLKDAIRVNDKTYHPICYEDVKDDTSMVEMMESESLETPVSDALLISDFKVPQEIQMNENSSPSTVEEKDSNGHLMITEDVCPEGKRSEDLSCVKLEPNSYETSVREINPCQTEIEVKIEAGSEASSSVTTVTQNEIILSPSEIKTESLLAIDERGKNIVATLEPVDTTSDSICMETVSSDCVKNVELNNDKNE